MSELGVPTSPQARFSSPDGFAILAVVMLAIIALTTALVQVTELMTIPDDSPLLVPVGCLGVVHFGALLATIAAYITWLYRVYDNLEALGATREHGLGWAIGAWFVPFLNLVRPFQIVRETFQKSGGYDVGETPVIVGAWWGCWVISNVLSQIGLRMQPDLFAEPTEEGKIVNTAASVLAVVAAVLAILVIREIGERQKARAASMGLISA